MLLKFLEKIGRKKVVLDRGPSHPKFNDAKPCSGAVHWQPMVLERLLY